MKRTLRTMLASLFVALLLIACGTLRGPSDLRLTAAAPLQYKGVNLSGAEFGQLGVIGTKGTDYTWPTRAEVDYFTSKGMNTFRVNFTWERLQPTANGELDVAYLADLDSLITYATSKGATVLLNPQNFARYYNKVVGAEVPNSAFANLWSRLATKYKSNPRVAFGLVNEPHDMPTEQWVAAANAATAAIRATGSTNLVSVPGNGWDSAASWTSNWYGTANSVALLNYVDTANNSVFEVHNYLDVDGGGAGDECASSTIGSTRMMGVVDWARKNGKKVWVGELGAPDTATCKAAVMYMLAYLQNNSDVVTGWMWWAAGPWWGEYKLSLEPKNGADRPQMAWLQPFISVVADAGQDADAALSTRPSAPIAFSKNASFTVVTNGVTSWAYVPTNYDASHNTPFQLFVWLHGCGGEARWDVNMVSPGGNQSWISLAVGGREKACWSGVATDGPKVLAAIADIRTHFNIDPRRIYLGGYSSGGDIGYPLAFANAKMFAGALFENTGPSSAALTAAPNAAWKLNIAQLSHTGDTTYPIAGIRTKMQQLRDMGFPLTFIEKPGTHYDADVNGVGTQADLRAFLLPYLNAGWLAPGAAPPPPPVCTFSYSDWSECQPTSTQTRTVVSTSPVGCSTATVEPLLTQRCTYVPPPCSYVYGPWGTCQPGGNQSRAVTSATPDPCTGSPQLSQSCTYVPPDTDGDGITDDVDKCPTVKGVKTTSPSSNGCVGFTVSATKTYDWGTGYCKQWYFKNTNPVPMAWTKMTIYLKDARLRGTSGVWGATFPNPTATGNIVVTPLSAASAVIAPGATVQTVGLCADYGPTKYVGTSGGLSY